MFGLNKKKKENINKGFVPSFGDINDFKAKHTTEIESFVCLAKHSGETLKINVNEKPGNNILVINDNIDSVDTQFVLPVIAQKRMSYVVYDPDGVFYEATAKDLKESGYDVQLVDMEDTENKSRIDIFEVANITGNPYWPALMFAGSIKCESSEIQTAHNLLMAMMQYLLSTKKKITSIGMESLLKKMVSDYGLVMANLKYCEESRTYAIKFDSAKKEEKQSVLKKIAVKFIRDIKDKTVNPNVFTITTNSKQTAIFIKRVPQRYHLLLTMMMFNLKTASLLCGNGKTNILIIDSVDEQWCYRGLLDRACAEVGPELEKTIAYLTFKKTISSKDIEEKDMLLIYANSKDPSTKDYIQSFINTNALTTTEEKMEISKKYYKGKPIPTEILQSSPISVSEMEHLLDGETKQCIIIDVTKKAKPVLCDCL